MNFAQQLLSGKKIRLPAAKAAPEEMVQELNLLIGAMELRESYEVPLNEVRFVVFDTETTGFHPHQGDEIISLGAVVVQGGQILRQEFFNRLVNPHREIPPVIGNLTGITTEQAGAGEEILPVLQDFLRFAGPCILIGHSVEFDLNFINYKLKQTGCQKIKQRVLDTYWLARAVYPFYDDHSLDGLVKLYQIENTGRHTSLGDALLTAQVLQRLLHKVKNKDIRTIGELQNFIQSQNWKNLLAGPRQLVF